MQKNNYKPAKKKHLLLTALTSLILISCAVFTLCVYNRSYNAKALEDIRKADSSTGAPVSLLLLVMLVVQMVQIVKMAQLIQKVLVINPLLLESCTVYGFLSLITMKRDIQGHPLHVRQKPCLTNARQITSVMYLST